MHLISPYSCNVDKHLDWFDLRNRSCFVYSSVCYCCCCWCILKWNITKWTILSLLPHISNENHFSWSFIVLTHAENWTNLSHSSYLVCCHLFGKILAIFIFIAWRRLAKVIPWERIVHLSCIIKQNCQIQMFHFIWPLSLEWHRHQ